jgi:hypothetical protein
MNVTVPASEEIKKFLAAEDDLPETAGLRVRVFRVDAPVSSTALTLKKIRSRAIFC